MAAAQAQRMAAAGARVAAAAQRLAPGRPGVRMGAAGAQSPSAEEARPRGPPGRRYMSVRMRRAQWQDGRADGAAEAAGRLLSPRVARAASPPARNALAAGAAAR